MESRSYRVCVLKVGSTVVSGSGSALNEKFLQDLCDRIVHLRRNGWRVVLVSSGAVAAGRSILSVQSTLEGKTNSDRRLFSAVGQSELISHYASLLQASGERLVPAQILLSRQVLADRELHTELRDLMQEMLAGDILPIINNNDSVYSPSLDFSDNDQIAAYVSGMLDADLLVLVTEQGGIFNKNPKSHLDAQRIAELPSEPKNWPGILVDETGMSVGGMTTKLEALRLMAQLGIPAAVVPSNAIPSNIEGSIDLSLRGAVGKFGTFLEAGSRPTLDNNKRWLCTGAYPKGMLIMSDPGAEVLTQRASEGKTISFLDVGVVRFHGMFERGDAVSLRDAQYNLIAFGRSRLASRELAQTLRERDRMRRERERPRATSGLDENISVRRSLVVVHANDMLPASRVSFVDICDVQQVTAVVSRMKDLGYHVIESVAGTGVNNAGAVIRIRDKSEVYSNIYYRDQLARDVFVEAKIACRKFGLMHRDDWILYRTFA